MEAREGRLLGIWCRKLQEELLVINAPVRATLQGSLDPDRAALLLTEKTRASTPKRSGGFGAERPSYGGPRARLADLVEPASTRDEPCGRSVPDAILKANSLG